MQSSSVIYGNYQVLSPNNILMFRCDEKRANWYLKRNLADIIGNNIIRLNFEPGGLGNHDNGYGLGEMRNICVNCGSKENLTRHHIVPTCYRKFLSIDIKAHNFHDILPMCVNCHNKYERSADQLKTLLANKYDAPIHGILIRDDVMVRYIKLSKTILSGKLPQKKKRELRQIIKDELNIKRLTKKKLTSLSQIEYISIRKTHGEMVVSKIDNVKEFIEMWRNHFIDNNICKYLPEKWSVKN